MSQPSNLPILSLAAEALAVACRSILALVRIYWLPIAVYTVAVAVARVIWFEHVTTKFGLPVWVEVALWAPFAAVITIAAFRYFVSADLPSWYRGFEFSRSFWLSILCLFVVNLVYRYTPFVEQESVWAAWRYIAGPTWFKPTQDGYAAIAAMRLLAQIAGFAVNAFVGAVAMGAIWLVAPRDAFGAGELKKLLLMFPLSLFAYLFIFEIVNNQVSVLINWIHHWLSIPYPALPQQLDNWRERLVPELLRELHNIPTGFVVTLLWLTALATVFRFLEGRSPHDSAHSDH